MHSDQGSGVTQEDAQFLASFETGQIANRDFHHRDHLRLAWIQIRRMGLERALECVTARSGNLPPATGTRIATTTR